MTRNNFPGKQSPMVYYPFQWTRNIWLIGIQEFPSFLVVGEKACAIIEAGVSVLASKLLADIKSLKLPVPLKYLIAAHAHADHVNGLIRLKQMLPELSLVGLKTTSEILEKEKIFNHFISEDAMYTQYLLQTDAITTAGDKLSGSPIPFDRVMADHETLDLGNLHLHFLPAPGHAPGNTIIHVEQDNALLISDTAGYANATDDILPLFFHQYADYLNSLEIVKNLEPDYIGLGHNVIITGKKDCLAFIEGAVTSARNMKSKIANDIKNSRPIEEIQNNLADKMVRYGLFQSFSRKTLMDLSGLIIRRTVEAGSR